jgi:sulfite exporter TauE/SafE
MKNKSQLYSGIIWIISAIALAIYGFLIFFEAKVWKIEDLINFHR